TADDQNIGRIRPHGTDPRGLCCLDRGQTTGSGYRRHHLLPTVPELRVPGEVAELEAGAQEATEHVGDAEDVEVRTGPSAFASHPFPTPDLRDARGNPGQPVNSERAIGAHVESAGVAARATELETTGQDVHAVGQ